MAIDVQRCTEAPREVPTEYNCTAMLHRLVRQGRVSLRHLDDSKSTSSLLDLNQYGDGYTNESAPVTSRG